MKNHEAAMAQARAILTESILAHEPALATRVADFDTTLLGLLREVGQGVMTDVSTQLAAKEAAARRQAGFTVEKRTQSFFHRRRADRNSHDSHAPSRSQM